MTEAEQYSKQSKTGEHQYVSGVMVISYNPFLSKKPGVAYMNYEVAELLTFWTERVIKIDEIERENQTLGLLLEKETENI